MSDYMIAVDENGKSYLAHYGIKGQKWGVRRFQNSDGSLTAEGKARYGDNDNLTREDKKDIRKEYRQDNKQAFEYGRSATIAGRAASIAKKEEQKAQKRYDKKPTEKNAKKLEVAKKLRNEWDEKVDNTRKEAEEHHKKLVAKYGNEHVSDLKFDKFGRVDERVATGKDILSSVLATTFAAGVAAVVHSPVTVITYPKSKMQLGADAYAATRTAATYGDKSVAVRNKRRKFK